MDITPAPEAATFALPRWSAAEFLDVPVDGLILRALVCRLGGGRWQWSITSIEGEAEGRLVSAGTERSIADARQMAACELDKCIHEPFA